MDKELYFFGGLIDFLMQHFNADYRIRNGVLRFERWDWWALSSNYVVPANFNNQTRAMSEFGDNSDEFKGGYTISFAFDTKDQNTFDYIDNMAYDIVTRPATTLVGYENAQGVKVIDLPIARAKRKATLSRFENLLLNLFTFVDNVTSALGGGSNFAAAIQSRTNNMEISEHFTSKPKIIYMNNALTGLAVNQASAVELWNEFHFINSFFKFNNKHNQWLKYTVPCSFCAKDFVSLLDNNFSTLESGEIVEVERLTWTPYKDEALLEIRVNKLYTTNLTQQYITSKNSINAGNINV